MLYIGEEWNSSKSHHVVQEKLIIQRVKFFGIVSSMHGCFWGLFKLCMKRNWMCVFCQHTVDVYCSIENLNTFSQPQKKYTYSYYQIYNTTTPYFIVFTILTADTRISTRESLSHTKPPIFYNSNFFFLVFFPFLLHDTPSSSSSNIARH